MEHNERIIDPEWADALIGLQMSVPNHWWKGCRGNRLHQGRIAFFHENTNKWQLLLDDVNDDNYYGMAWDAVLEYADVDAGTYLSYTLPAKVVHHPADQASWQT